MDLGLALNQHCHESDFVVYSIIDGQVLNYVSGGMFGKSEWKIHYAVLTNIGLFLYKE